MDEQDPKQPLTRIHVGPTDRQLRVDQLVARALGVSRRTAAALCAAGSVRSRGRAVGKGERADAFDELSVVLPETEDVVPEPELPLPVRLERPDLVVVSKPAGMPTVPIAPGERGTLAAALLARYPEIADIGHRQREPGVIHRLDTLTSGLVIAARTRESFERLTRALRSGTIEKRYLAVVSAGLPATGVITLPLAPDPKSRHRVRVAEGRTGYQREAETRYRVLREGSGYALVELEAHRAFRHQVRAHLSAIGHPIVGDRVYGGPVDARLAERHALHASYAAWAGDATRSFAVTDPVPLEFLALLRDPFDAGSAS